MEKPKNKIEFTDEDYELIAEIFEIINTSNRKKFKRILGKLFKFIEYWSFFGEEYHCNCQGFHYKKNIET